MQIRNATHAVTSINKLLAVVRARYMNGEIRLRIPNNHAADYFTNDPQDAWDTAEAMARVEAERAAALTAVTSYAR